MTPMTPSLRWTLLAAIPVIAIAFVAAFVLIYRGEDDRAVARAISCVVHDHPTTNYAVEMVNRTQAERMFRQLMADAESRGWSPVAARGLLERAACPNGVPDSLLPLVR